MIRSVLTGTFSPALFRAWWKVRREPRPPEPAPLRDYEVKGEEHLQGNRVSVLVPTLDRYPYLTTLLTQLREQTVRPFEILVVDQTPPARRHHDLASDFPDLPLRVFYRDEAGQCSARNIGLEAARGDFVLFLDDDDEITPPLIARHVECLKTFTADVSSGVANEVDGTPLPADFKLLRTSDVFPTNNTLIRRSVLGKSGLFDLAYEHGARADGDLGMRIYLSGAVMILNPAIAVLHHHAPQGGLRQHRARVVTYGSSRRRLSRRHLPSPTELYLNKRYFTGGQVREKLWISALGTMQIHRGRLLRVFKVLLGTLLLPITILELRRSLRQAEEMLERFPQIPQLE